MYVLSDRIFPLEDMACNTVSAYINNSAATGLDINKHSTLTSMISLAPSPCSLLYTQQCVQPDRALNISVAAVEGGAATLPNLQMRELRCRGGKPLTEA